MPKAYKPKLMTRLRKEVRKGIRDRINDRRYLYGRGEMVSNHPEDEGWMKREEEVAMRQPENQVKELNKQLKENAAKKKRKARRAKNAAESKAEEGETSTAPRITTPKSLRQREPKTKTTVEDELEAELMELGPTERSGPATKQAPSRRLQNAKKSTKTDKEAANTSSNELSGDEPEPAPRRRRLRARKPRIVDNESDFEEPSAKGSIASSKGDPLGLEKGPHLKESIAEEPTESKPDAQSETESMEDSRKKYTTEAPAQPAKLESAKPAKMNDLGEAGVQFDLDSEVNEVNSPNEKQKQKQKSIFSWMTDISTDAATDRDGLTGDVNEFGYDELEESSQEPQPPPQRRFGKSVAGARPGTAARGKPVEKEPEKNKVAGARPTRTGLSKLIF